MWVVHDGTARGRSRAPGGRTLPSRRNHQGRTLRPDAARISPPRRRRLRWHDGPQGLCRDGARCRVPRARPIGGTKRRGTAAQGDRGRGGKALAGGRLGARTNAPGTLLEDRSGGGHARAARIHLESVRGDCLRTGARAGASRGNSSPFSPTCRRATADRWRGVAVVTIPGEFGGLLDLPRPCAYGIEYLFAKCVRRAIAASMTDNDQELSTRAWGRQFLPSHLAKPASSMHRWLDEQLALCDRQRGVRINVIGPRGSAKSTIATLVYVLRVALEGREPYIWIVSDTQHQARRHLENLRVELVDNGRLREAYPDSAGKGPVWRQSAIVLRNGVTIEGFGTGQRIRGYRRRDARPTLIVGDDLQNDQHMDSALQREHSSRWFHGSLLKAGTDRTNILNLATALHHAALAIELEQTPGWISRRFQSIVAWPERDDLWEQWEAIYRNVDDPTSSQQAEEFYRAHREEMLRGSEVLWPEQEDLYALMRMRVESGHNVFAREKQSTPIAAGTYEWPEEYFADHIWFDAWPVDLRVRTMALDPSVGQSGSRGDYSAFVMLGVDAGGIVYVEAELARRSTASTVATGVELYRQFGPDRFGIEANQFQELFAPQFAAEFARRGMLAARTWLLRNTTSKDVRIRRLGPLLSAHRLRFRSRSASTQRLVDQLRHFPLADHDDGPDALEMAVRLATQVTNKIDDGLGERLLVD
ncbi:MAG: hypothetical protein DWQ42_05675 [Planctomycetota bacterium]|nr:MAG: hypothetical protein DWQ42_05675 [Planctomycetota bacterium]REK42463.1 MAG: hypothetical protein DWQ46_13315 [Planctomycetota bacterium]